MKINQLAGYAALIHRSNLRQLFCRVKKIVIKRNPIYYKHLTIDDIDKAIQLYNFNTYAKHMGEDEKQAEDIVERNILKIQNKEQHVKHIDWNSKYDLLLTYELNYFDFVKSLVGISIKSNNSNAIKLLKILILEWIRISNMETSLLWDAYPISRRCWNWINALLFMRDTVEFSAQEHKLILNSIYSQMCYLEKNLEYDLNNNHLTANAKTLLLAGLFFKKSIWTKKGKQILEKRLNKEINQFGFHDERSMSYHMGAMLDYAEVYLLLEEKIQLKKNIRLKMEKMVDALMYIVKPDGKVPLISDTVSGYPCCEGEIINLYAVLLKRKDLKQQVFEGERRLIALMLGESGLADFQNLVSSPYIYKDLSESGNIVIRDQEVYIHFNCVPFGPMHCPGHSHCDALSIVLNVKGEDIFVDPGVFSYNDEKFRTYFKSTARHNTAQVCASEQFEILGNFRVGRISKVSYQKLTEKRLEYEGRVKHYSGKNEHIRTLEYDHLSHRIRITDKIISVDNAEVKINYILAPNVGVNLVDNTKLEIRSNSRIEMLVKSIKNKYQVRIYEDLNYSSVWNEKVQTQGIQFNSTNDKKFEIIIEINLKGKGR